MTGTKHSRNILFSPEFLTGLFILGALAILFYFTVIVRGWDFFSGNQKSRVLSVSFPHASTLAVNDKVKVIGVDMGVITAIDLAEDNNSVIVHMKLRKAVPIYKGYEFSIQSSSVFGGAYVNIKTGNAKNSKPLPENTLFKGVPPIDIITEASELIAAFREDEKYLREVVVEGGVLDRIKNTLARLDENAKNMDAIFADIRKGKGTLGKLANDPAFYDNAQKAFANLGELAEKLQKLASDVEKAQGLAGKLLNDEKTAEEFSSFLANMNSFMKKVNSNQSSLNRILADDGRFFEDMDKAVRSIARLTGALEKGEGTAGKFMKDEALYNELLGTVKEVRAALEDFREMAPTATFSSILLGAL